MKTIFLAVFSVLLLNACATRPAQPDKPVATPDQAAASATPESECPWLPVTEYMLGPGYRTLLYGEPRTEWFYPLYAGAATISWMAGVPFAPAVDILMAPLRIAQPCLKVE